MLLKTQPEECLVMVLQEWSKNLQNGVPNIGATFYFLGVSEWDCDLSIVFDLRDEGPFGGKRKERRKKRKN